ncbi:hypothetical protein SSMOSELEY_0360 [Shigella sonnei str. Moseley]|nr:hypothetical protein SSMOSELEY_0360 [Shigella sonnei str. Moseley]
MSTISVIGFRPTVCRFKPLQQADRVGSLTAAACHGLQLPL